MTSSVPIVLITGAARRLGRHTALAAARAGWGVAVHYRGSAEEAQATVAEIAALGVPAQGFGADLADEAACAALLPRVAAHFGRVDAVVNNASAFEHDDVASFSTAMLERQVRANTVPAVVLARALHAHLLATPGQRQGVVVNLLDQKLANLNPDHFSYTLSKAALDCATTLLAMALAPRVRVAAVAPGLTLHSGPMNDDEFAAAHAMAPLGRSSTADDIAQAVLYLLHAPAITGTTLFVDGGQHLQGMARDVLFVARDALPSTP
jgi:NAD(P)-dependent dehydrogenase (short-subunit alcohol dehydrogenase family)